MDNQSPTSTSAKPSSQLETWRAQCEARDWVRRFREIKAKKGVKAANQWWRQTLERIEKHRGKQSVDKLRRDMNDVSIVPRD
jgi:hypothetical protein